MKKTLLMTCVMMLSVSMPVAWGRAAYDVANDLCSPEGIARLVPQMRGPKGRLQVPDPTKNLTKFLQAYSALRAVIATALTQAEMRANPYTVANQKFHRLRLGSHWWAAEVGFESDHGRTPDYTHKKFGDYGDKSFMDGIIPVKGTSGSFYAVPGDAVFIAPMPTLLKCVNLVMETSGHDSGTFITPSYALGSKSGKAFMFVNGCQNTATLTKLKGMPALLSPGGSSYLGIQLADSVKK